jgi:hypothetical protein
VVCVNGLAAAGRDARWGAALHSDIVGRLRSAIVVDLFAFEGCGRISGGAFVHAALFLDALIRESIQPRISASTHADALVPILIGRGKVGSA